MISRAVEAEVLRLHHAERWPIGTIARQLLLHHSTVRRVLAQAGVPAAQKTTRPSLADPFIPFILETLKQYPKLCASRLHIMVRERGYRGGADHFRWLRRIYGCAPCRVNKPSATGRTSVRSRSARRSVR
jgi:hypothetical protein